jgi:hypothetical protein
MKSNFDLDKDRESTNLKIEFNLDPIMHSLHRTPEFRNVPANMRIHWVDMCFDYSELEIFKKNKKLLFTNIFFPGNHEYQNNIHTVDERFYGIFQYTYNVDAFTAIEKNFNCLMNRFDIVRQSWFYHLIRGNWLDQGFVSFNCGTDNLDRDLLALDSNEIFEKVFQKHNYIFHQEHDKIKGQLPFRNFPYVDDPSSIILKSKFSIVLETFFHENRAITFTEKIMRSLQLPRPWVLFTAQHGVSYLRKWGFDVLDDIVDHGYDKIENQIARQLAILDQAEYLMKLNMSDDVIIRCHNASKHNQALMTSWRNEWQTAIDDHYEIACQKALAL